MSTDKFYVVQKCRSVFYVALKLSNVRPCRLRICLNLNLHRYRQHRSSAGAPPAGPTRPLRWLAGSGGICVEGGQLLLDQPGDQPQTLQQRHPRHDLGRPRRKGLQRFHCPGATNTKRKSGSGRTSPYFPLFSSLTNPTFFCQPSITTPSVSSTPSSRATTTS